MEEPLSKYKAKIKEEGQRLKKLKEEIKNYRLEIKNYEYEIKRIVNDTEKLKKEWFKRLDEQGGFTNELLKQAEQQDNLEENQLAENNKVIREIEEGNCFGELALLVNEPRSATIEASTKCTLYILTKRDFDETIDKNMLEYLQKKISLQDNFNMTLNDLFFVKNLGKGKFGNVALVHDKKNYYAIKAVSR